MRTYFTNIAVSYSILVNAIFAGMRYEMLSSRAYRCGWWVVVALLDVMFGLTFGDWDHCRKCYNKQRDEGIYEQLYFRK